MIKLTNLDKYFFRRKANEIHVLNDISLDLPDRGLVVLLGPSGSGKTTLLNVIGGLDKTGKGTIDFDGEVIQSYKSNTWDNIRNRKIGYIFQNYNLLDDLTVYDNIKISLNMAGIVEKEEIDKRIDYILDKIGMINYRKRRASQLSGGQQQRVAIARALCKNPKVIIADEPTGNLDSKNTIEIMNIIKSISKEKLVILVTHEQELADFYADRVINLIDGQIVSDSEQEGFGNLEYKHDSDIYLKDMTVLEDIKGVNTNVKLYSDEPVDSNFDIKLVIKNNTLYIQLDNEEFKKRTLLSKSSEVRLLDKHYEKVTTDNIEVSEFDFDQIINEETKLKKASVISTKESLSYAFKRFIGVNVLGKILYVGFAGLAFLVALSIGMLFRIYTFQPNEYLNGNHKDSAFIDFDEENGYADYLALEDEAFIDYLIVPGKMTTRFETPLIFQAGQSQLTNNVQFADVDYLDGKKLAGGMIEGHNQIIIDKYLADNLLNDNRYQQLGFQSYSDLLTLTLNIDLRGQYEQSEYEITIAGIYETESPVFYASEELIYMIYTGFGIYEIFEDDITLTEGVLAANYDEVIIIDNPIDIRTLAAKDYDLALNEVYSLDAVGLYNRTSDETPDVLITVDHAKELYFNDTYTTRGQDVQYHINDHLATNEYFTENYPNGQVSSITLLRELRFERINNSLGQIIFAVVVVGASCIFSFFMLRSSLLSRIYEISVYRALGASKLDIIKMFFVETALITTLTSLPGFIIASFLFLRLEAAAGGFIDFMEVSPLSITVGLLVIYGANLISGLLPVTNLLRRTPAQILSMFDF